MTKKDVMIPNALPSTIRVIDFSDLFKEIEQDVTFSQEYLKNGHGFTLSHLIPEMERQHLLKMVLPQSWAPVSVTGMSANYSPGDRIGSYRLSIFSSDYTNILWERLSTFLPNVLKVSPSDPVDHDNHFLWKPVGLNPLLRFIKYEDDGILVPHYDAPYVQDAGTRSLVSVVIYLDNRDIIGGATRFIKDPQAHLPLPERDLSDWKYLASPTQIDFEVNPSPGTALVFDHRILHDAEKVQGVGHKIVLRTDVMFQKIFDE